LPFLYIAILFYDVIYVGMVYMRQRAVTQKPTPPNQIEMHMQPR
jgi:hypothetical protein